MPQRVARPCLERGCPELVVGGQRCAPHAAAHEHARGTRHERGYTNDWSRLSAALIAGQPWCTRCGRAEDLTVDHIRPKARGGTDDPTNLQVLCRGCNSAKRDR